MKLTVLLMTLAILNVSATGLSQTITFSGKEVPLEVVFSQVEKQTGYFFLYSDSVLAKAKRVTINVRKTSVEEFLRQVFATQPLTYSVREKNVFVDVKVIASPHWANVTSPPITIKGRVVNEKGEPVIATVLIRGTNKGATTDANGQFELANVDGQGELIISGVNIETQTISLRGREQILIHVTTKIGAEEEVVVNAGYYSVREKERTGNISRITSKDIEDQPVVNFMGTMQGRMAGVQVKQVTGMPGAAFDIQIRGQNSIRADGNDPLYIIDGAPYAPESVSYGQSNLMFRGGSPLNSINPSEIESIEVLKDADATAIYGSRGANGVVLITTKKGKAGRTQLTTSISRGFARAATFMQMLNREQYLEMRREAFANDSIEPGPGDFDLNGTWDSTRFTDWQRELMGGTLQQTDLLASLSGGSAGTQFLISGHYHHETTVFPGAFRYKKGGMRAHIQHASTDQKFSIQFTSALTIQDNNQPQSDLSSTATLLSPVAPALYTADGKLNWENGTWENPLSYHIYGTYQANTQDLLANTQVSYRLLKGLQLKANLGFTHTAHEETRVQPSTMFDPSWGFGSEYAQSHLTNTTRQSWIMEPQANYTFKLDKARVELLAGATFQRQDGSMLAQYGFGFSTDQLIYNLAAAFDSDNLLHNETTYKYQAVFGRANVNWDKRYIVNMTVRRDGSSRFGPGRQFGNFGAIGAAWLMSEEPFLQRVPWLSLAKLRGSYGTTGSDRVGDYQFLNTYSTAGSNYLGISPLEPARLFNPNFGWETNRKLELAAEAGFLQDRFLVSIAWYRNRSSSQLVGIPQPGTTGFSSLQANLDATVQNTGIEVTVNAVNIRQKHFSWTTSVNIAASRNKLLSFPGLAGSTYRNRYVIGQPLDVSKMYEFLGVDPATGLYQVTDANKDGKITSVEDRQTLVDFTPAYFGGIENEFRYKQWELGFLWQFNKQRNYGAVYNLGQLGQMFNHIPDALDRWQRPGDVARYQRYTTGVRSDVMRAFSNYYGSDGVVENALFWRLKTAAISYRLPLRKFAQSLRLSLQGQNLITLTSYKGRDPELRGNNSLPPLKVIVANLQLTF